MTEYLSLHNSRDSEDLYMPFIHQQNNPTLEGQINDID